MFSYLIHSFLKLLGRGHLTPDWGLTTEVGKRNLQPSLSSNGHQIISLHTFWVSIDVTDLSWVVCGHCTVHYTLHYTSGEQPGPDSPVLTLARTQLNIV